MILSPISARDLPARLDAFARTLAPFALAHKAFARVAGTRSALPDGQPLALSRSPCHHAQAVALCQRFGMAVSPGPMPYTWDGATVRGDMEPSVIIHEVGHYQIAAPERRRLIDFGLGAGPETEDGECADRVQMVTGVEREMEEALASLLGILWEAELGQPAVAALVEQNWLEGGDSLANRDHFRRVLAALAAHGLVDRDGRPTTALRRTGTALLPADGAVPAGIRLDPRF